MSLARDREEFVVLMAREGVPLDVARALMRAGASLHRLAELACSSEAADRDRVPCPGLRTPAECLCEHWSGCGCPEGATGALVGAQHHDVPRIAVREHQIAAHVRALCQRHGLTPIFSGDPRGAVVKLKVPSGRTNDWGHTGICVP